jgi:hypothetical protein
MTSLKTLQEKMIDAEVKGGNWLAMANEAAERGDMEKANKFYEKAQAWLDRMHSYESKINGGWHNR